MQQEKPLERVCEKLVFEKMVLIKLQGGLGNQMFQYAVARSLTSERDSVYIDTEFFENQEGNNTFTPRKYELSIFRYVKICKAPKTLLNLPSGKGMYIKLLRRFIKPTLIYQKLHEYISLENVSQNKFIYLTGYFQSEKYFKHIRQQLLREFEFPLLDKKNTAVAELINNAENSVSIHVRRKDYVTNKTYSKIHGVLPISYYNEAINALMLKGKLLTQFFFSDDIDWVKKNFSRLDANCYFIDNNSGEHNWKDMALMRLCKHHIVANSSFSWWGAWLSKKQGDTFAPSKWVNPDYADFDIHDFVPEHWTIVNI